MAGDGVRNPADLTPVIDELDDINNQLDDIEAALVIIDNEIAIIDGIVDDILVDTTDIIAALVVIDGIVDAILVDTTAIEIAVNAIRAQTDGLPVLTETGGTITTDGNVQDLYINNAPGGVFRPICVKIDFTNHTAGETVVITTNYRIRALGGLTLQDTVTYAGVPTSPLININLEPNRFGIRVTIQTTAGANRDYDWEVFYEVVP